MSKNVISEILGNNYNLEKRIIVDSLKDGAEKYGGATKIDGVVYSNFKEGNNFNIKDNKENIVGLIVPGTININQNIDNTKYINKIIDELKKHGIKNINNKKIVGAWISQEGECIIENNNLITFNTDCNIEDIKLLQNLAKYIKKVMNQEGVSIIINDSLSIC